MSKERDQKITKIIEEAVNDGIWLALEKASELKAKNFTSLFLPKHEGYPSISSFSSGLPHFFVTSAFLGDKISYKQILLDTKKDFELKSWKNLIDLFINDEKLNNFIKLQDWGLPNEETKKEFSRFLVLNTLRALIDSIIHSSKNPRINSKIKKQKISKWVDALTKTEVNYELVVPIIFHQPDCQRMALNKNIRIQKLNDKIQLSRNSRLPANTVAHKDVVGAATHGVIITNILKNIPNDNQRERYKIVKERINDNFDLIIKIFSIIRLVTNESIGFCQVLAKPLDFEENWFVDLPDVEVYGYKKYPPFFEEGGWHVKRIITKKQLELIKKYFNQKSDDKKIVLAKRKLLDSDMRINIDDSILDVATGLESLLSDSTDNLKYKISLRSAVICKKKRLYKFTPVEVKNGIKTFYDLRSAIIHGNTKNMKKYKEVKLDRFEPIDTLLFGRGVLAHLIEFLINYPQFSTIENIDNYLLEGK